MTKAELQELRNLIEDACSEWFSREDEEFQEDNEKDSERVDELLNMIPVED